MIERHVKMIELVADRGEIETGELARLLNTSEVTVRNDLNTLSKKGILARRRGYATLPNPDDTNYHMALHYEAKLKIAAAAAQRVRDGETIIVGTGSTCAMFAAQVVETRRNVTILTNSAYVAANLCKEPDGRIILLGGSYQKHSQCMVGPLIKRCLEDFHVGTAFVGADGFTDSGGFFGVDMERAEALREMVRSAERVCMLLDGSMLGKSGTVSFLNAACVAELFTDSSADSVLCENLRIRGMHVNIV